MKWYVQLAALLLITQTSFSQLDRPYVPPSVNVSGIMKHTNIQVGRWFAADPVDQYSSLYIGMGNNPVIGVDPDGRAFWPLIGAIGRHMAAGAIAAGVNYFTRQMSLQQEVIPADLFREMARGAVASGVGYGLGVLGLEIATNLAKPRITFSDGLVNLGYQAIATTLKSVALNLITRDKPFSRLDIGVGDFYIPIRDGKFSWNWVDHAGNLATLRTYMAGLIDVINGKARVELDRLNLSPRFLATKQASFGCDVEGYHDESEFGWMYKHGRGKNFNENGASFIMWSHQEWTKFHESLHGIFNRLAGRSNSWIDYFIFGSRNQEDGSQYFERVLHPYVRSLYPNYPK